MINTWPKRIYLQPGDDDKDTLPDFKDCGVVHGDVTWCVDRIHWNDVVYVREPAWSPNVTKSLNTQDNRVTGGPLFVVFQKRDMVVDPDYDHDRIVWYDVENSCEATPQRAGRLEAMHQRGHLAPDKWSRLAVKAVDYFVTACLTEQGCKDYLAANGHNLRQPFVYVTSLHRNQEMIDLRNWLKGD